MVVPRFQTLTASDIEEKQPGDFVTVADRECEELLEQALRAIAPDVPMLGEEAAAADPELVHQLIGGEQLWVVDPLDGTRAFIDGNPDFSIMVALIERGNTTAAWVYHPIERVMWSARLGQGTWREDQLKIRKPTNQPVANLHGFVKTGFMDPAVRVGVTTHFDEFGSVEPGPASAGFAYPGLIEGSADFVLFWRTLAWDHAPGALIAQEAGCYVAGVDGSPYRPGYSAPGLLAAPDADTWRRARDTLLPAAAG